MRLLFFILLCISLSLNAQVIPEENLLLHLTFDNEQLIDKSIYDQSIIDHNTEFRDGLNLEGLYIPGGTSYLEVQHSESLKIPEVVSTSIWYKHQDQENNGFYSLIEQSTEEFEGHSRYGTWIFDKRKLLTCIEPDECPNNSILCQRCTAANIDMEEGKWYHIVSQYDGSSLRFYINGVMTNSRTFDVSTGISVRPFSLTIGTDVYDPAPLYLEGLIDEVKIFNLALNETQVMSLYNEFSAVPTKDLSNKDFKLYPNPASDLIMIEGINKGSTIEIFNAQGVLLHQGIASKKIDLKNYAPGMYILKSKGFNYQLFSVAN